MASCVRLTGSHMRPLLRGGAHVLACAPDVYTLRGPVQPTTVAGNAYCVSEQAEPAQPTFVAGSDSVAERSDSLSPSEAGSAYSDAERAAIYRVIRERRDMRHFLSDQPVDAAVLARILDAAHQGPSVGLMQPWRIVRVTDPKIRLALHAIVEEERLATADALGQRRDDFMRLKVQGIVECGEVLVVGLMADREKFIFGRRTIPTMDLASAACAIQNMWLAARAEGLGLGWVSMFEPESVRALFGMPEGASPVAILCLGAVPAFYPVPMLEGEGWAARRPLHLSMAENRWPAP
ncbi:Nitroreductase-like protein [Pavlovales sp. CCMP2436]|nr:Nitroreductase-like protein [Pavlovales sp. CCMP2436]